MKLGGSMDTYVSIYPVGVYRDLQDMVLRPQTRNLRSFWSRFQRSWRRRSYWNGYLCEPYAMPEGMTRCGSGLIPGRAYQDYMRRWRAWKRQEIAASRPFTREEIP